MAKKKDNRRRVIGVVSDCGKFSSLNRLRESGFTEEALHLLLSGRTPFQGSPADAISKGVTLDPEIAERQGELSEEHVFGFGSDGAIDPPYDFTMLYGLFKNNVTHSCAIETKASDYAYHGWVLEETAETVKALKSGSLSAEIISEAKMEVMDFLSRCVDGLLPIDELCRDLGTDYEVLGSAGFEVIRDNRGYIRSLNHIPFMDMRVLRNALKGDRTTANFVQQKYGKFRYFAQFGRNVAYRVPKNERFDPISASFDRFPKFQDRANFISPPKNYIHYESADELTTKPEEGANEFYMLARPPRMESTVYGTPAGYAARQAILGELQSELYNLRFFSASGVPQYAVILEYTDSGMGPIGPDEEDTEQDDINAAQEAVQEFFAHGLKTTDRKVLIMASRPGCNIRFEKLSEDVQEASFKDYGNVCRDRIRMAHRVPPAALGIIETAQLGAGSTSSQLIRYRDHVVSPGQRIFATMVSNLIRCGLLIPFFNFKFRPMPVDDENERREFVLKQFERGAITVNEYRKACGYHPFTAEEGKSTYADALFIRSAQNAIIDPKGDVQFTMPGQDGEALGQEGQTNRTRMTPVAEIGDAKDE